MDTYHTGLLIRALMFLGIICPLVIAGVLVALREKRCISNLDGDTSKNPGHRPVVMQRSLRYPANREQPEANDSEASALVVQRRAA